MCFALAVCIAAMSACEKPQRGQKLVAANVKTLPPSDAPSAAESLRRMFINKVAFDSLLYAITHQERAHVVSRRTSTWNDAG